MFVWSWTERLSIEKLPKGIYVWSSVHGAFSTKGSKINNTVRNVELTRSTIYSRGWGGVGEEGQVYFDIFWYCFIIGTQLSENFNESLKNCPDPLRTDQFTLFRLKRFHFCSYVHCRSKHFNCESSAYQSHSGTFFGFGFRMFQKSCVLLSVSGRRHFSKRHYQFSTQRQKINNMFELWNTFYRTRTTQNIPGLLVLDDPRDRENNIGNSIYTASTAFQR